MPLTPAERLVRNRIYEHVAATGSVPTPRALAGNLALAAATLADALERLHAAHVLVLDAAGAIRMAPPFAGVETPHRVTDGTVTWYGNCAWDALGIAAALARPVAVRSACPDCGDALELTAGPDGIAGPPLRMHVGVPAEHWWEDIVFT